MKTRFTFIQRILSLVIVFTVASFMTLNAQCIVGTYTVGVGGDYTTLTDAVADYNTSCLDGPVVFELTDANYAAGTATTLTTILLH